METDVEADEEMDVGEVEPEPEQLKTGGPGGGGYIQVTATGLKHTGDRVVLEGLVNVNLDARIGTYASWIGFDDKGLFGDSAPYQSKHQGS